MMNTMKITFLACLMAPVALFSMQQQKQQDQTQNIVKKAAQQKQQQQNNQQHDATNNNTTDTKNNATTTPAVNAQQKTIDHERVCPLGCGQLSKYCPNDQRDIRNGTYGPCNRCGIKHL